MESEMPHFSPVVLKQRRTLPYSWTIKPPPKRHQLRARVPLAGAASGRGGMFAALWYILINLTDKRTFVYFFVCSILFSPYVCCFKVDIALFDS